MATKYTIRWADLLRVVIIPVVIVIVAVIGFIIFKGPSSDLTDYSLTNASYKYSFEFYRNATPIQLQDESNALRFSNQTIAVVKPVNPFKLDKCSDNGSQWKQVFTVNVSGVQYPVCTPNNVGFTLYFKAANFTHLFTVSYASAQTSKAYPDLKAILGSVSVQATK